MLVFLCPSSIAQNQTPVIQSDVEYGYPNNTAYPHYDLSDAENDPLEVTVQFSTDGGKTLPPHAAPTPRAMSDFPFYPGTVRLYVRILRFIFSGANYTFRIVADDKQPFDIQALVNEVDSNRLRNDLMFVEGIRHRTTGLAHLNETGIRFKTCLKKLGLFFENKSFSSPIQPGKT